MKKMKRSLAVSILPKTLTLPAGVLVLNENPLKLVSKKTADFHLLFLFLFASCCSFPPPSPPPTPSFSDRSVPRNRFLYCFFFLLFIIYFTCFDRRLLRLLQRCTDDCINERRREEEKVEGVGGRTRSIIHSTQEGLEGGRGESERFACRSRRCRQGTWPHFGIILHSRLCDLTSI